MLKNTSKKLLHVAIDSEYTDSKFVSLQVVIRDGKQTIRKAFFLNSDLLVDEIKEECLSYCSKNNIDFIPLQYTKDTSMLRDYLNEVIESVYPDLIDEGYKFKFYIYFFYSPKDIIYAFGFNNLLKHFTKEVKRNKKQFITQKRSIFGSFNYPKENGLFSCSYKLRDLCGYTNRGLGVLAQSLNLNFETKNSMDEFKERMDIGFQEKPIEFIQYGMEDATILHKIYLKQLQSINKLMTECLRIPGFLHFKEDDFPVSTGKLVSSIFEKFLLFKLSGSPNTYYLFRERSVPIQLALAKLGVLPPSKKEDREILSTWQELFKRNTIPELLDYVKTHEKEVYPLLQGKAFEFKGYSYASIKWFMLNSDLSTAGFNALVSGGRANNEQPDMNRAENCLDIDLSGCYGNALKNFSFPIGIPTIVAYSSMEESITLQQFLDQYRSELVPNLYKITVSGELTFEQDLIFSKLLKLDSLKATIQEFKKEFNEGYDDRAHLYTNFALILKEIENGVITHDILQFLEKASSNQELKEIMNLKVVTAAFWKKSDMVDSVDDWVKAILQSEGKYEYNSETNSNCDNRSRKWYKFELFDFIDPLIKARKELISKMKQTKDPKEARELNAYQECVKLIINAFYGALASLYFDIGNTVVADNITARARLGVFMMAKALGCFFTVTDGGAYKPSEVFAIDLSKRKTDKRKPSLHTLSNIQRLREYRTVKTVHLGGIDWDSKFHENPTNFWDFNEIDEIAHNHIISFWSNYNCEFPFNVEHKTENTAKVISYASKANYMFLVYNEETNKWDKYVIALRGINKDVSRIENPWFLLLTNIIHGVDEIPKELSYTQKSIVKIGSFLDYQKYNYKDTTLRTKIPGDSLLSTRVTKFFNIKIGIKH